MNSNNPALKTPNDPQNAQAQTTKKFDLSVSQTIGGALAAMTAAALGSRLGVGGTITGAAFASIIAGVGGTLYTASLRSTKDKVKTVWSGRVAGSDTPAAVAVAPSTATSSQLGSTATRVASTRTLPWKGMVVAVAAIFGVAAVALTSFEALAGAALSGEKGTTIQQVAKERKTASKPSGDTSETPSPSESARPTPSEPSPSETSEPGPGDEPAASQSPTTEQSDAGDPEATSAPEDSDPTDTTPQEGSAGDAQEGSAGDAPTTDSGGTAGESDQTSSPDDTSAGQTAGSGEETPAS